MGSKRQMALTIVVVGVMCGSLLAQAGSGGAKARIKIDVERTIGQIIAQEGRFAGSVEVYEVNGPASRR